MPIDKDTIENNNPQESKFKVSQNLDVFAHSPSQYENVLKHEEKRMSTINGIANMQASNFVANSTMQLLDGSPKKQLEEVVELGRSIEMRDSVVPNDSLFS